MKSGLGEHDKVDLIILSSDMQNYMGYTLKKVHAHVPEGCAGCLYLAVAAVGALAGAVAAVYKFREMGDLPMSSVPA